MNLVSGDTIKPLCLFSIGELHIKRFNHLRELKDVNKAIDYTVQAVQLIANGHVSQAVQPDFLTSLGSSYHERFLHRGDVADLDNMIKCLIQAWHLTPSGHADGPRRLYNLGKSYMHRFERYGDVADVENGIRCNMQAVQLAPDGHDDKAGMVSNLGSSYMRRFQRHGDIKDVNNAIEYHIQAVQLIPDGHAEKPRLICNLGNSYQCRFMRRGDLGDLDDAIKCHMKAVQLTPDGHVTQPAMFRNLGSSHMSRFGRLGDPADLQNATQCYMQVVQITPDGHPDKPSLLSSIGGTYASRFKVHSNFEDLENAVKYQIQAVRLTPDGHAGKPGLLAKLGSSYMDRFRYRGDITDIDNSIKYHMQALKLSPDGHAERPSLLCDLGNSYQYRFEHQKHVADIENAIKCHIQAAQLLPDGHADRPTLLGNLGSSYSLLSQSRGNVADMDSAIKWHIQALQLTPEDHQTRPWLLGILGGSYQLRFQCKLDVADVDNAINFQRQVVHLTSDGHAEKPMLLMNLAYSYQHRFKCLGEAADVENSISCLTQAELLTPDGHAHRPTVLISLGYSYMCRFQMHENISDDNTHPIQPAPGSHLCKLDSFSDFKCSFSGGLKHGAHPQDLEAAISAFKEAAQSTSGHLVFRFDAALRWARSSLFLGVSPRLAYCRAMELVPQLVWLGSTIRQRYAGHLQGIGQVAMEAASWAISVKQFDYALEWLEQGRSVVWNQVLHLRSSFDDLYIVDPQLATRLKEVAHRLECASTRSTVAVSPSHLPQLETDAQQHRSLAIEWDRLLDRARQLPGFEHFLRPRKVVDLVRAAKDGPVIVINVHQHSCDALIIQPNNDTIAHVPLENRSPLKLTTAHMQLMSLIQWGGRHRGLRLGTSMDIVRRFKMMLATLWTDIVEPIFNFLCYTNQRPIEQLPHVTWCTTGPLSFLPLHAAGCSEQAQPNALDLVVSSYTPTLSSLLSPSPLGQAQRSGILAVCQEYTEGHCDLPCTKQELVAITENAPGVDCPQLEGSSATVAAVLSAMEKYSWVHLACHATQNQQDPTQSAFLLHDGNLSLAKITQQSFKGKGLAFLSACQTAAGDVSLPDEAVHLAAGMKMAGYSNVIGTMWSIQDQDAPEVARGVYAELLKDGTMNDSAVARALHSAVVGLREKVGVDAFKWWVPFIHIGS